MRWWNSCHEQDKVKDFVDLWEGREFEDQSTVTEGWHRSCSLLIF
jgi:hypothetical protein